MIVRLRVSDLIKHKGGATKVGLLCGVSQPTVSRWSAQESIPPKYAKMLEALWGIDCDLMHNPWGIRSHAWATDAEQAAVIRGDYDLGLSAPSGSRKVYAEKYDIDPNEPVEIEPLPEDYNEDDDPAWREPAPKKSGWSDDELEALLREMEEAKEAE